MNREPHRKYRLILDFKSQFPEKLYDVANDGFLVYWNRNGSVSIRDETEFEDNVMRLYPGFLQIASMLNFKRLFREYGFDRNVNQDHQLEYSHPMFVRGRRELLPEIKTRRKSFKTPNCKSFDGDDIIIPTDSNRRYSCRKRQKTTRFSSDFIQDNDDKCGDSVSVQSTTQTYHVKNPLQQTPQQSETNTPIPHAKTPTSRSSFSSREVMQTFAEKEFDVEEYNKWLENQRKRDAEKASPVNTNTNAREFWWMYGTKSDEVVNVVDITKNNQPSDKQQAEDFTPCGFCKCCSAISNYVHVFGEVPENIQVIDYVEEIIETDPETADENEIIVTQVKTVDHGNDS